MAIYLRTNITGGGISVAVWTNPLMPVDTTPPVLTLIGSTIVPHERGTPYIDAGATAFDNVDGDITDDIITTNLVDENTTGEYTVTYEVTDSSGNAALPISRIVQVVDNTAPVLSAPTGASVNATVGRGTVDTDEGNGTLYAYVSTNASETAVTIKASGQQAVLTSAGGKNFTFTGLTEGLTYYNHYVQDDAIGNESNVVSSSGYVPTFVPVEPGSTNEQAIAFFRNETGLNSYNFNELAIAYYKQVSSSVLGSYNDLQYGAQQTGGFVGESPVDWRNYL